MKPKDRRDRLFRHSRPNLRAFELFDGEEYHKDLKILWIAHQRRPFYEFPEDLTQQEFIKRIMSAEAELIVIEDENRQYSTMGPIGVISVVGDWKIEPHVEFFDWATPRNVLRGCVSFFQYSRNTHKVGCVLVHALQKSKNLFDRVCAYGVLHYVGRVRNGDPRGDEYLYSVRGKKR